MKAMSALFTLLMIIFTACKRDSDNGPDTTVTPPTDTIKFLTKRPLVTVYWGGCCYDRNDVGPLDAIPDSVDVVNIFTMGIEKNSDGKWTFEHRGVSGYNDWNQVLTLAHGLQKRYPRSLHLLCR
jgi:hypothetical protein